jgi:hypothetical protein
MVDAHVILLADDGWDRAALAAELVGRGLDAFLPELDDIPDHLPPQLRDAQAVARTAIWLNDRAVPGPVVIVAHGDSARLLPAIALSQRSAHRLVTGYVIVDAPATPAPSLDWPAAPVWWVATPDAAAEVAEGALSAGLRGFHVLERGAALDAVIAAIG